MIIVKNKVKTISFSSSSFKQKAEKILQYLKYSDFDLTILLVSDSVMKKYNKKFRNIDKTTDVLSFPYYTDTVAGKRVKVMDDEQILGDILISLPYVQENRHNLPGDFEQRMNRMLVHGICHLLGYDHQTDADYKKMIRLENKLIKMIK
ncbi:rRNA maturation RNase YbeY [Candidatus Babeliales bacterium]|nr:rRNA maturation RNase YbeY [Candidatus Babeliales bacterium]